MSSIKHYYNSDGKLNLINGNNITKNVLQQKKIIDTEGIIIYIINDMHNKINVANNPTAEGAYYDYGSKTRVFYQSEAKITDFVNQCNTDSPDVVVCLGDAFDTSYTIEQIETTEFKTDWDRITSAKYMTIGNHDGYSSSVDLFASQTDYTKQAESEFNFSKYITKNDITAKLIFLDMYMMDDGEGGVERHYNSDGTLNVLTKAYLTQEIDNSTTDNIIIMTHTGFYKTGTMSVSTADATWFHELLEAYKTEKSDYNFFNVFGHSHIWGPSTLESYDYCKFLNCAATIEYINEYPDSLRTSHFTKLNINLNDIIVDYGKTSYGGLLHI